MKKWIIIISLLIIVFFISTKFMGKVNNNEIQTKNNTSITKNNKPITENNKPITENNKSITENNKSYIEKDAAIVVDNYLTALMSIELPVGRDIYQKSAWPSWGPLPVLLKAEKVFEAMFDTDCEGVRGYSRLVVCDIQSEAKTKLVEKYVVVAYPDKKTQQWKVWCFIQPKFINDAAIGERLKELGGSRPAYSQKRLAYSYSGAGKLRLAREAYSKASALDMVEALNLIIGDQ